MEGQQLELFKIKEYSRLRNYTHKQTNEWNIEKLDCLSAKELKALALLCGIPYTGRKNEIIKKLKQYACSMNLLRGRTKEQLEALPGAFLKKAIRNLPNDTWKSQSSKEQMAETLMNWKINCINQSKNNIKKIRGN